MRLLILSDVNSSHTQKWATGLAKKGHDVAIFSISQPVHDWYSEYKIGMLNPAAGSKNKFFSNSFLKISYFKLVPELKSAIAFYKPQVVHAHYATSYGLLGAFAGFHPFAISAWGSDVMDFPNKSFLHKTIVKYNLRNADRLFATSEIIVKAMRQLSSKKIYRIPFGIDVDIFKPVEVTSIFPGKSVVIGTVKALEDIYGIDILIKSFKKVSDKNAQLKLLIVGGGSKEQEYKKLVKELSITDSVVFTGRIEHSNVVSFYNMIDIFVNVSRSESFGVSVLEASACEKPVIVSNAGGLNEVVADGYSGIIVEAEQVEATANAMERLVNNQVLCRQMGINGRLMVQEKFNFNNNLNELILNYEQLLHNAQS